MKSFLKESLFAYKGLFMWLNTAGFISAIILYPIATVLMYTLIGRFGGGTGSSYALSIITISMSFSAIGGLSQSYSYDRSFGTISYVFASRGSRLKNFLAREVLHFPNAIIAFILGLATACMLTDMTLNSVSWLPFILSVLVIGFSLVNFGQALGVVSIVSNHWIDTMHIALGVQMSLCGAIIPLEILPKPLVYIGHLLPITNGLTAVKRAFSGASFSEVYKYIVYELIIGLSYCVISYAAFRIFELIAKKYGTLDMDVR